MDLKLVDQRFIDQQVHITIPTTNTHSSKIKKMVSLLIIYTLSTQ